MNRRALLTRLAAIAGAAPLLAVAPPVAVPVAEANVATTPDYDRWCSAYLTPEQAREMMGSAPADSVFTDLILSRVREPLVDSKLVATLEADAAYKQGYLSGHEQGRREG